MPVELGRDDETDAPPVRPETNGHRLLAALADHPEMGFTPSELVEMTDVADGSVHKTLARLREKGLVRNVDGYWALAEDVAASRVATLVGLSTVAEEYGDDAYGEDDGWVESAPDLGENA
ncbi:MarR family transcriptional regulator [Halobaculum sp. MBLA0147]|uniref:MarR family transcriptional regulator n=1 Tax=Halobaculum sp. MBLA0147 TaxID=3079934 RepID=UPI00352442E4